MTQGVRTDLKDKAEKRTKLTFRADPELIERVEKAMEDRGVSMQRIVERAVERYLDDLEAEPLP